jgi:DNA transformation protein and related proteins
MGVSDEFGAYVVDQLGRWGAVQVRKMFGGAGLYCEGVMFGLIADDVAYLKVDDSNREDYVQAGSGPFQPFEDKKMVMTSYYEIPPGVLENAEELGRWAEKSLAVARKKTKKKVKKKKKESG